MLDTDIEVLRNFQDILGNFLKNGRKLKKGPESFGQTWIKIYIKTGSSGKLRFTQKCILRKWLYNVTKDVGRVDSVSKSFAGCLKVCGNDCPRRSVQSGHMVAEGGFKPLSAVICLMEWGVLQLPILSPNQSNIEYKWVVLQKLPQLSDTHFSQVLNKFEFFSWFYKVSSRSSFHLNYTSFLLSKQQQHGF